MRIIVDGYGKTVAKRDNQIVIKENGKEEDYFVIDEISQILITGKGSITFDALSLLAEYEVDCVSINWKGQCGLHAVCTFIERMQLSESSSILHWLMREADILQRHSSKPR